MTYSQEQRGGGNGVNDELIQELKAYEEHCANTGQEQVADLVGRAITALSKQESFNPVTQEQDEWIEWEGGECPVSPGTETELEFRNGVTTIVADPEKYYWGCDGSQVDIIRYRIKK